MLWDDRQHVRRHLSEPLSLRRLRAADKLQPMPAGELSWDDLRYLEALGRLGTAGRAARELGTSASTVYRRVANLEEALGVSCVQRGDGKLTDAGHALARVARQTGTSLDDLTRGLAVGHAEVAGEVRLTTVEGMMPLLAEPLARLTERHPELTLHLVVVDQGPSVRRREADIAVGVMPSPPASLWGRKLFSIQYGVFGTREACGHDPLRWIVTGQALAMPERTDWEREHATHVAATINSTPSLLHLLHQHMGVAILPVRLALEHARLVELERYRPSVAALERSAWLLTHPELRDVPRIRAVIDTITAAIAD